MPLLSSGSFLSENFNQLIHRILFLFRKKGSERERISMFVRSLTGRAPRNLALYELAFSHRSVASENEKGYVLSNERLEYLGDAILGAIIADMLFKRFPYKEEGFLTEMRSRLVSREHLKQLAMKLGVDEVLKKDAQPGSYRSMYGDALEAFIGAFYLDQGYDQTKRFIIERIINTHVDLQQMAELDINFKSQIINWGQKEKRRVSFEQIAEESKDRLISVRLLVDGKEVAAGTDFVKKKAEQIAAEKALKELGLLK